MTAPLKPWEMNGGNVFAAGSQTLQSSMPAPGDMGQPTGMPLGAAGNVRRIRAVVPPLPPRPAQQMPQRTGYYPSRMGSYSMPYSSYGSYGMGGTYGSSYGMYGSGNYGMFGMNRYGVTGNDPESRFIQLAEESSRPTFQSIEAFVQAFGSMSFMLESTFHAIYSSFRAVLSVAENLGRLRTSFGKFFSVFAVLRTLQWMYKKLLYLLGLRSENPQGERLWEQAASAATAGAGAVETKNPQSWPVLLFMGIMFIGPYLVWKLLNSLNLIQQAADDCLAVWKQSKNAVHMAMAMYPFVASTQQELSLNPGDKMYLAPKEHQTTPGWLLATLDGKRSGLVPHNYIRILTPRVEVPTQVVVEPVAAPPVDMPLPEGPAAAPLLIPDPNNDWNTP